MSQLKVLASAVALTGTAIGAAISLDKTPWGPGGYGRNGVIEMDEHPGGAAVVKWQGHNGLADGSTPGSGDSGWYDLHTTPWSTATSPLQIEIAIPRWIRYNITTLGTGTLTAVLRGTQ